MAFKFNGINRDFLTFVLLIIFAVLVSKINCDLAPKEEDDDDSPQEQLDLKKDVSLTTLKPTESVSKNLGFIHAFIASFSVIIVSEIGDKTFFIAAIMSMVNNVYVI
jgi:Ca2+/H+ antiporter, TMEM165/GDT1 family